MLLIIVHWSSLCLPCVNGSIFVTIREVHVSNIKHVIFFWFVLRNQTRHRYFIKLAKIS